MQNVAAAESIEMSWEFVTAEMFDEIFEDHIEQLTDRRMADLLGRMERRTDGHSPGSFAVHAGSFATNGNFAPPAPLMLILGDLTVEERVSLVDPETGDGNATLIIFGSLRCRSLLSDWASVVAITGDCIVSDWVYTAFEDASLFVGGNFSADVFIGLDIPVEAGGDINLAHGDGYGVALGSNYEGLGEQITPPFGMKTLGQRLGLQIGAENWNEVIEERLYRTGSIYP